MTTPPKSWPESMPLIHVLLVEDELAHEELIRESLACEEGQFQIHTTQSLAAAESILDTISPDIVLTDWRLPDGKGIEILRLPALRQRIPIIVMTAYGDEHLAVEAMKAGAMDYVVKSTQTFLDMPHLVMRALREWGNIQKRSEAEEKLRLAYDRLEVVVAERTADLEHARATAENASRAKSDFLANMSHELRTPLHGILSFSEFGLRKIGALSQEKTHYYFQMIHESGERLLTLLNEVLDLSKLESGRMAFEFREFALPETTRKLVEHAHLQMASKSIAVTIRDAEMCASVCADELRIEQVVRNILSNAIKFSPIGGEILIEYASTTREDGSYVQMQIRDQGPGIPPEEIERIFDKFYQSTKTASGAGGSGLGLAICREIVSAHRGRIWAENAEGGGSLFCLELPCIDAGSPWICGGVDMSSACYPVES